MNKTIERRIFAEPITVRSNEDGTVGVRGYAAVFNSEAHGEVIRAGAFNRTLAQRDDIRLLVNHDGVPLARTKSGTLQLGVDDRGLWFDAPSLDPSNPRVQELVSAMSRGDIDQCSFAGYFETRTTSGTVEVLEVKAVDVSIVTYPWYEDTETSLTGDRNVDRLLVSARSAAPSMTAQQSATALRALQRMAPPGKESWNDIHMDVWDELERSLDSWVYIAEIGDDWVVYRVLDMRTYEYGPYMQCEWTRDADGVVTLGEPFAVQPEFHPVRSVRTAYAIADARALLGV